jgi:hypothetical protein
VWRQNTNGCRGRAGATLLETLGPFSSREKVPTDEGTGERQTQLRQYESCGQAS